MHRNKRISAVRKRENYEKEIKYLCDYQQNWTQLVPPLHSYTLDKVDFLSITGDAPKDFVTDREYRPGHRARRERRVSYIAKVGSKFYPNESIVEQFITRIGQQFDLRIADSKLRIINNQVRFMSKYFLNRHSEQLTHGAEIFELCLGKENYAELAEQKIEREYFSFQMAEEAIKEAFPSFEKKIIPGFVEMLTFDALIGHNDRHPYNWGVVVPISKKYAPYFSPVFDTARALFWNIPERRLQKYFTNSASLEAYIKGCKPPLGWDSELNVDFFRLIGLIWSEYVPYRGNIEKFLVELPLKETLEILDKEFGFLMSEERRMLIKKCLTLRQQYLCRSVNEFK
jgi:hypothetical protein